MHGRGREPYGRHERFAPGRERDLERRARSSSRGVIITGIIIAAPEMQEEVMPEQRCRCRWGSSSRSSRRIVYVQVPADQAHAIVQAQQEGAEGAEGGGGAAGATQQAADAAEGSADAATKGYFSGGGFADYMGMYNYVDPQAQWDFYHGYGAPSYGTPWEGEEPIEESYFPHWW